MATIRTAGKRVAAVAVLLLAARAYAQPPYGDRIKMWMHDLDSPVGEVRAGAALALGEAGDPRAVKPLQGALKDEYVDVRKAAAWSLGELGDKTAAKPLSQLLHDDKAPMVRASAADALGKIQDSGTALALEEATADRDVSVRCASIEALARVDKTKTLHDAMEMLGDSSWTARNAALNALGEIKAASALDRIMNVLAHDEHEYVRAAAAHALGRIGDNGAVSALEHALKDSSTRVQGEAAASLLTLGVKIGPEVKTAEQPQTHTGTDFPPTDGAVEL